MTNTTGHAIDFWEPRRAISLKAARRHSAVAALVRIVCLLCAAASLLLLAAPVVQSAFNPGRIAYRVPAQSVTILNPRFEGRDSQNRPYVITADSARRRSDNPSVVDLVNPRLQDQSQSAVSASEGTFDRDSEVLDLVGDVVMNDAAGYDFRSDRARLLVRENRVEGRSVLRGEGPLGKMRANSYEVSDNGDRIVLSGQVWTQFRRKRDDADRR
jgi:lipopolysaccharide export system protein LptC